MSRLGFLIYLHIADDNPIDLQKMLPFVIPVQPICKMKSNTYYITYLMQALIPNVS